MGKARSAARRKASAAPAGPWGGRARPNVNPFEVKVNRQKFQVLGRKTRHDVGLPGVSRARALQKVSGEPALRGGGRRSSEGSPALPAGLDQPRGPALPTRYGSARAKVLVALLSVGCADGTYLLGAGGRLEGWDASPERALRTAPGAVRRRVCVCVVCRLDCVHPLASASA